MMKQVWTPIMLFVLTEVILGETTEGETTNQMKTRMSEPFTRMMNKYNELEKKVNDSEAVISQQKKEQDDILTRLKVLESRSHDTDSNVATMKNDMEGLGVETLKQEVQSLSSLPQDIDKLQEEMKKARTNIFYQVTLVRNNMGIGPGILHLDKVLENAGGCFDLNTGYFTAPVSGTYLFWAHVMAWASSYFTIQIKIGTKEIARGYTEKGITTVASTTAVTFVAKGDKVSFVASGKMNRIRGDNYSGYGGVLLHAD